MTRPERDYLGELEVRRAAADAGARPMPEIRPADRPAPEAAAPRAVTPEPATTSVRRQYDAEDLEIPSFLRRNK
jgi:hypothetical protein